MKVLIINPGATSTKIAVFDEEEQLFKKSIDHSAQELDRFDRVIDQADFRQKAILDAVTEGGFRLTDFAAVCGRGGLYRPIPSGTYAVNDRVMHDVETAPYGEHPSNLGAYLARRIGDMVGIPAFFVDPVCVDEMTDVAHYTGFADFRRLSQFHALNQKATARLHCERMGWVYEESNLIVAHMGGGISVAAHKQGRIVDVNNALDGDGPFAPDRAGSIPSSELIKVCFSGQYTKEELLKFISSKGGLVAYLGTNSVIQVMERIAQGDQRAKKVLDAMCYNIVKQIGAMAAALSGSVQTIVLTGGIDYNEPVVEYIRERCSFIAPIAVYPGENALEALVTNALVVLRGVITPKVYK